MGGALPTRVVGVGYLVDAKSPVVAVKQQGEVFHVVQKEYSGATWAKVVAEVESQALADVLVDYLAPEDPEEKTCPPGCDHMYNALCVLSCYED